MSLAIFFVISVLVVIPVSLALSSGKLFPNHPKRKLEISFYGVDECSGRPVCWGNPDGVWIMVILLTALSIVLASIGVVEIIFELKTGIYPISGLSLIFTALGACLPSAGLLLWKRSLSITWLIASALWLLSLSFVISEPASFGVVEQWGRFVLLAALSLTFALMGWYSESLRRDGFLS